MNKFWFKLLYCWAVITVCTSFMVFYLEFIEIGRSVLYSLLAATLTTSLISFLVGSVVVILTAPCWED